VQPGVFAVAAVLQTSGAPVIGDEHVVPVTPQTAIFSCVESMLGGVMLCTYARTSATVVGPVMPDAELVVRQLLSFEQVNPRTAA